MEQTLTCRVFGVFPFMMLAMTCLFTAVGVVLTVKLIQGGEDSPGPMFIVWLAILGWSWLNLLYLFFYEIRLYADGRLTFRAVLRRLEVHVDDVESIGPAWGGFDWYTLTVRTRRGSARVPRQMTNMFDLTTRLRGLNPSIDLSRF